MEHVQGFEDLLHLLPLLHIFGRKPEWRSGSMRMFLISFSEGNGVRGINIFLLTHFKMQRCLHRALILRSLRVRAAFQSSWVSFDSQPRYLPPSPAFTAPSYVLLLRANNYSSSLGTFVLK